MNIIIKSRKTRKEKKENGVPFCEISFPMLVCVDPITQDVVVVNRRSSRIGKVFVFSPKGELKYEIPNCKEKWDINAVTITERLVYFSVKKEKQFDAVLVCTRDGDILTIFSMGVRNYIIASITVDREGNVFMCEAMKRLVLMLPQDTEDGVNMIGEGILVAPKEVKAIRDEIFVLDSHYNRMSLIVFNNVKECVRRMDFVIKHFFYRGFDVDRFGNFVLCTKDRIEKWSWKGKVRTVAVKNEKKGGHISGVAIDSKQRVFYGHRRREDKNDCIVVC